MGDRRGQRLADFRPAAATIFRQEDQQAAHGVKINGIENGPAVTAGLDQAGIGKDQQLRRHRVGSRIQFSCDLSGCNSPGPAFTSCRKTSRRDSWESAESRLTASDVLICQYSMKYRITSTRPGNPPKRKCWHHTAMIERAERSPQRVLCVDAPDSALVQLAVHRALVIHAFAPEGTKA